jgi:acyl carrier protein
MDEFIQFLKEKFRFNVALSAGTPLLSSGLIDSLSFADFLSSLAVRYGVTVDPADVGADNFDRVEQVFDFIKQKRP